jgi:hypothetical protein
MPAGQAGANTSVLERTRAKLLELGTADTLLDLLHASDAIDGGTMFSELYRGKQQQFPAGHTRHTKASDNPEDYVNQFAAATVEAEPPSSTPVASAAIGAAAPSSSATASAPAAASAALTPTAPAGFMVRRTPYMFKSHLLRLVGSLSHGSVAWQTALGGRAVYACMNHSVLDDHNPLMREHSVLALRNLLEGNETNQRIVSDLRTQAVANQEQLRQAGIEAEVDEETGKVRVATAAKK